MNGLVNEAVKRYLATASPEEREVEDTLASLRDYRERGVSPNPVPVAAQTAASPDLTAAAGAVVVDAAREFVRRVSARYPVKAALLFGSRARGTHRHDSDVDIAVILCGERGTTVQTSLELADIAFEILLDGNVYIQPLPIWEKHWEHPEHHANPRLIANVRREGVVI